MGRLALLAALLAAALLSPATALAADATIIVGANGEKTLVPANVTVDPDNTVTWQWGANSQKHHIVSDATTGLDAWDSGERSTGSFARAFPRSGSFRYHCALHPDVMRGTVTVTGVPVAALAAPTPSPAFVGEAVTFDASASTDDSAIVEYRWDFDGGGVDDATTVPTTSHAYATAGSFTAKVTVVDVGGRTADATRSVTVFSRSAAPPPAPAPPSPASVAPLSAPAPVAPLPAPAPSVPAPSSTPAGAVSATAPSGQRLKSQRGVRVRVSCAAACQVTLSGTVTVRAKKLKFAAVKRSLAHGRAATITLKVARRDLKALRAARGRLKASVTVRSASGVQHLAITLTA
jgi:plastocyanin